MCSRQIFAVLAEIAAAFKLVDEAQKEKITNGAPTDATPMITLQELHKLQYFKWGYSTGYELSSNHTRLLFFLCFRANNRANLFEA